MWKFSPRSEQRLSEVHPQLVQVVRRALEISEVDFAVVEGKRTRDRQAELVRIGASKTMFSRHITGHAVDLAPIVGGTICWKWPAFTPLVDAMKRASQEMGVMLVHGADWKSFPDGPHHELDRRYFP
jgi:peptidoglycan L-alanyl-D-glutamate endopeptidase CwlK